MWKSKEIVLPILIGFSITSISVAFVYFLFKKDDKTLYIGKKKYLGTFKRIVIECTVPRSSVPAVIGRGGMTIKDIQDKTGTKIHFSEDKIESPNRICIITGNFESVQFAEAMIKNIISNQPVVEIQEIYVPNNACRNIMGERGETIQKIQSSSCTKITIEDNPSATNSVQRKITIKGTAEQIVNALMQIEDRVREYNEQFERKQTISLRRLPRRKVDESENTSEPIEIPISEAVDSIIKVCVTDVDTPNSFFIQLVGSGSVAFDQLADELNEYYNKEENRKMHVLKEIKLGQMVAVNCDNLWHRAKIVFSFETFKTFNHRVFLVDYGDLVIVNKLNIFELRSDFLTLRMQAMCCSLDIEPRHGLWSEQACKMFRELTSVGKWQVLEAKVIKYIPMDSIFDPNSDPNNCLLPVLFIDLFYKDKDKNVSISSTLISYAFADYREDSHKVLGLIDPPNFVYKAVTDDRVSGQSNGLTNDGKTTAIDATTPRENRIDQYTDISRIPPLTGIIPGGYEDESDVSNEFDMETSNNDETICSSDFFT